MKPLKKRILKRKLRNFWDEWGITKQEALEFVTAALLIFGILCIPILAEIVAAFI